jgi:ABC-type branched-subunit amino acid transport system permease subunit
VLALNLEPLTGGSYGRYVPPAFFLSTFVAYYPALLVALVAVALNWYLSRTTLGLAFRCIKGDEDAASSIALGVERSLLPPLMALLGGTGTVLGPVFGTAIIRLIETVFFHYLRLPVPSMLFFGVTLMLVALLVPEGLLRSPWVRRRVAADQS